MTAGRRDLLDDEARQRRVAAAVARLAASRVSQGLPVTVADAAVLRKVATLMSSSGSAQVSS